MARQDNTWLMVSLLGLGAWWFMSQQPPRARIVVPSPGAPRRPDELAPGASPSGGVSASPATTGRELYPEEQASYGGATGYTPIMTTLPGGIVIYSDEGFPVLEPGGRPVPRSEAIPYPELPPEHPAQQIQASLQAGYTIFS